ncbi:DUF6777 domain-containing protein [Streptomyces sp. NPDC002845]
MTMRTCLRKAGKSAARRLAFLLVGGLILSGCTEGQRSFVVKAVAVGVPSLAPFFDEGSGLGEDQPDVLSEQPRSGLQQGNTPGLYGGTRKPKVCDVDRLKDFLTDPGNRRKAQEWARVVGITPDRIDGYLDSLTPVLLRHDTLVKNHDYKKGKAVAFDALLEAGIAILVDEQGLPAVKCSCGNPLRTFDKNPRNMTVKFQDGNEEWEGYDRSAVLTVKPSSQPLKQIALVDVEDPQLGINRQVGDDEGANDEAFDTSEERAVPDVTDMTFAAASQRLSEEGLAAGHTGDELPPGDAVVTGSDPGPTTPLPFGAYVMLSVDQGSSGGSGSGEGYDSGSSETETDPDPGSTDTSDPDPGTTDPSEPESSPGGAGESSPGEESPSGGGDTPGAGNTPGGGDTPGGGNTAGDGNAPGGGDTPGGGDPPSGGGTPGGEDTPGGGITPSGSESTPVEKPPPPDPMDPAPTTSSARPPDPAPDDPVFSEPASSGPVSSEPVSSGDPAAPDVPAESPVQAQARHRPGTAESRE